MRRLRTGTRRSLCARFGRVALVVTLLASFLTTVAAQVTTAPSAGAAPYQDWPTFLHDATRSAATADPNLSVAKAPLLKKKWAHATGGPIATSTAIVGQVAYVGSWDGYEYALNTSSGALVWKQFVGITNDHRCHPPTIGITSGATVSNGVVYVGGGDSYWYALDAATGAVLWKVFTGDAVDGYYNWATPLVVNGAAYIGIASNCDNPLVQGQLWKVDLATHAVVARYKFVPDGQVGGGIWTTPTYDAATNTIFVSTGTLNNYVQTQSQAIVALDAATLEYRSHWQLPFSAAVTDSDWGNTPTLMKDSHNRQLLAVANKNGVVYAFDRTNVAAGPVWQVSIAIGGDCPTCGDGTISSGSFANGVLYYAGGNNVAAGQGSGGSVVALDPATGAVLWRRQTEKPVYGSIAYVNGMVALAQGQTFEVLNAADGSLLYSYVMGADVYGAVSVGRSQFYVGSTDGSLYAFGLGAAPAIPPPDANCPVGFRCEDVRNPAPGSEQSSNGVLTVTAAGAAIHGTSDQFRFISKPVTGDSESSVRITAQSTQNKQPQAGLMVRQAYGDSTDPTAPFFGVLAYPNALPEGLPQPQIVIWYRTKYGKNSIELTKWYPAQKPVSVMVQRRGDFFSAGISFDGVNFQLIPGTTVRIDMPATTRQGLAVNSGGTNNYGTASFTDLSVGGPLVTSMFAQPPAHPCPTTWSCTDIGNPNPPGDTTGDAGALQIAGTGTGFGGVTDSAHYVYRSVTGDTSISARVTTAPGVSNAQQGLMMRASTLPDSPMYSVSLNPGGSATVLLREHDGIKTRRTVPLPAVTSPAYLKIVRYTGTHLGQPVVFFSTLTSTNGVDWNPALGSTAAIDLGPGAYLAGVVGTAAGARVTTPATFDAIAFDVPTIAPPGICGDGFTCADVGIASQPSNVVVLNDTWTIQASGSDIWSNYDTFHFAYQDFPADPENSVNGDGTVSARVVAQANPGGPWMKSGVMLRAGSDPQAAYYGLFATPANGVVVQWRSAFAGQTNSLKVPAASAPLYLLVSRYTDTAHGVVYYTAYTSFDGRNFTYVPGSTVPLDLPGQLVGGIASDSYDSAKLSSATFEEVALLGGSSPPPFLCPSGWECDDIGGALPPGQDQLTDTGTWNVTGGGGDIWDTADSFHYDWQPLGEDGTVSMHVVALQTTNEWAKAGPMLRASVDPGSPYYAALITPSHGIAVQWRTTADGGSAQRLFASSATYLRVAAFTAGDGTRSFTAYTSPDGTAWTALPSSTVVLPMAGSLLAGTAVTSHDQGNGSQLTADGVTVAAGAPPPPGTCPTGWSCTDVGGAVPVGSQDLTGSTWTVAGGGGDIWDVADSFRFVSQPLAGDGTLSARVAAQGPTDQWAKAGVMLRADASPGAPYYGVFVTPLHGVVVQRRLASGALTQQVAIAATLPQYLRVTRAGTTFTASISADGQTWVDVVGAQVSIPALTGGVQQGLAVTSHNVGALSNVTIDSVITG